MGFRTVVVFNNDQASEWQNDPELGKKIASGTYRSDTFTPLNQIGGHVLECVHADTQTLAILDGYNGRAAAHTSWYAGQTKEMLEQALLRELADKLGYYISKKPQTKVSV
jgi:hypothetical protein